MGTYVCVLHNLSLSCVQFKFSYSLQDPGAPFEALLAVPRVSLSLPHYFTYSLPHYLLRRLTPIGIIILHHHLLEETDGNVQADGDVLGVGETSGSEWDVVSMLVMQRGLVAASWVGGRRMMCNTQCN